MFTKVLHKLYTGLANQKERIDEVNENITVDQNIATSYKLLCLYVLLKVLLFTKDLLNLYCGLANQKKRIGELL